MPRRGKNFTELEKLTLYTIIQNFTSVIESRSRNANNNEEKERAWNEIARIYNAHMCVTQQRTTRQLRRWWLKIKQRHWESPENEFPPTLYAADECPSLDEVNINPNTPPSLNTADAMFSSNVQPEEIDARREHAELLYEFQTAAARETSPSSSPESSTAMGTQLFRKRLNSEEYNIEQLKIRRIERQISYDELLFKQRMQVEEEIKRIRIEEEEICKEIRIEGVKQMIELELEYKRKMLEEQLNK